MSPQVRNQWRRWLEQNVEGLSIGFSCYVLKDMDGNDMEDLLLVFSHRLLWPLFGEKKMISYYYYSKF